MDKGTAAQISISPLLKSDQTEFIIPYGHFIIIVGGNNIIIIHLYFHFFWLFSMFIPNLYGAKTDEQGQEKVSFIYSDAFAILYCPLSRLSMMAATGQ